MAAFLRRKSKQGTSSELNSTNSHDPSPKFPRSSTGQRPVEPPKTMVSSPMLLSSKSQNRGSGISSSASQIRQGPEKIAPRLHTSSAGRTQVLNDRGREAPRNHQSHGQSYLHAKMIEKDLSAYPTHLPVSPQARSDDAFKDSPHPGGLGRRQNIIAGNDDSEYTGSFHSKIYISQSNYTGSIPQHLDRISTAQTTPHTTPQHVGSLPQSHSKQNVSTPFSDSISYPPTSPYPVFDDDLLSQPFSVPFMDRSSPNLAVSHSEQPDWSGDTYTTTAMSPRRTGHDDDDVIGNWSQHSLPEVEPNSAFLPSPSTSPKAHRRLTQTRVPASQSRISSGLYDDGDEDSFLRPSSKERQSVYHPNEPFHPSASRMLGHDPSHTSRFNPAGANRRVSQPPPAHVQHPGPPLLSSTSHLPRKSNSVRTAANFESQGTNGTMGKPLIFSAVASIPQPQIYTADRGLPLSVSHSGLPSSNMDGQFSKQTWINGTESIVQAHVTAQSSYPSPPSDYNPNFKMPLVREIPSNRDSITNYNENGHSDLKGYTLSASSRTSLATSSNRLRRQLPQPPPSQTSQPLISTFRNDYYTPPTPPILTNSLHISTRSVNSVDLGTQHHKSFKPEKPSHHIRTSVNDSVGSLQGSFKQLAVARNLAGAPKVVQDSGTFGVPLDGDPFARVEGVKMLQLSRPVSPSTSLSNVKMRDADEHLKGKPRRPKAVLKSDRQWQNKENDQTSVWAGKGKELASSPGQWLPTGRESFKVGVTNQTLPLLGHVESPMMRTPPILLPSEDQKDYLTAFLAGPQLLWTLLEFLSFYDWCMILSLSKAIRFLLVQNPALREIVLERFLKTVGYSRWIWNDVGPLSLSLQDLIDYMRGVSIPTHEYARIAALYIHSLSIHPTHRDESLHERVRLLSAATRAYTRVVLRIRAQAERESSVTKSRNARGLGTGVGSRSRSSSRPPSPATSGKSHSNHNSSPGSLRSQSRGSSPSLAPFPYGGSALQSPLVRLRRAPLLRVFVPSPEGDWLSDRSVLECEAECRNAGVTHLMKIGDVVWDVAVGDEGNVGRLIWDGSYLIDLDYAFSEIGDLPKYMATLSFPPSYFHRIIRTGPTSSNPIAHINLQPWGEEIAANLQLLQDRVRTETPQGAYHNVVRWVHRSSFVIRPQARDNSGSFMMPLRIAIPDSNLFVDPGWYGTVVVETEGTNESLANLQARCGPGAFPPRPRSVKGETQAQKEAKLVFRILREKSRPGEIWIRTVSANERLL